MRGPAPRHYQGNGCSLKVDIGVLSDTGIAAELLT